MPKGKTIDRDSCSICGAKNIDNQMLLLQGKKGAVCLDCVYNTTIVLLQNNIISIDDLSSVIANENKKSKVDKFADLNIPTPKEIKAFLDEYVIGQQEAKKCISVAVYNHYKRIKYNLAQDNKDEDVEIEKSNILMVGPTGTGKTLLARSVAKLLNVPFTIVDATVFTQAGYVGEDIESILSRLLQEADYDVKKAEVGIVFIDEIDKLTKKNDNPSITRDVGGEGVQQGMLKLLEGSIVNVPPKGGRKHPDQDYVKVNTQNILFICGGAFDGIERMVASRMNTKIIGYGNDKRKRVSKDDFLLKYVDARDLKMYGMIPELLGRLPVITHLETLDRDALLDILTKPKNAITKQYIKLLAMDGIELSFTDEALSMLIDKAIEQKIGARGLRSIIEKIMNDIMFNAPSSRKSKIIVDKKIIDTHFLREDD